MNQSINRQSINQSLLTTLENVDKYEGKFVDMLK